MFILFGNCAKYGIKEKQWTHYYSYVKAVIQFSLWSFWLHFIFILRQSFLRYFWKGKFLCFWIFSIIFISYDQEIIWFNTKCIQFIYEAWQLSSLMVAKCHMLLFFKHNKPRLLFFSWADRPRAIQCIFLGEYFLHILCTYVPMITISPNSFVLFKNSIFKCVNCIWFLLILFIFIQLNTQQPSRKKKQTKLLQLKLPMFTFS